MTTPIIAMIGAGNMGSSLIGGMIKNGHPTDKLIATEPNAEKREFLQQKFGIQVFADNLTALNFAEVVIFAVKPQALKDVVLPLQPIIRERKPLVISVAAGINIKSMEHWLGADTAIVRVMPNTPALIGAGASALFANTPVTQHQRNIAESILRAVGIAVWIKEESQMDVVTALSGSGPAYFFLVQESLQAGAEALGLPADIAQLLTQQTALGAAMMAVESSHTPAELRKQVTSPGGTTESAVNKLEALHLRDTFKQALQAAKDRSEELAHQLGD